MKHLILALALLVAACATTTHDVPPADVLPHASDATPSLHPDEFDAPAAISVAEARKATGEVAQATHEHHDHEAALYVCPMHPEVTSRSPGQCPKCGMTLVRKEAKK
jgi:hypothetical protein